MDSRTSGRVQYSTIARFFHVENGPRSSGSGSSTTVTSSRGNIFSISGLAARDASTSVKKTNTRHAVRSHVDNAATSRSFKTPSDMMPNTKCLRPWLSSKFFTSAVIVRVIERACRLTSTGAREDAPRIVGIGNAVGGSSQARRGVVFVTSAEATRFGVAARGAALKRDRENRTARENPSSARAAHRDAMKPETARAGE